MRKKVKAGCIFKRKKEVSAQSLKYSLMSTSVGLKQVCHTHPFLSSWQTLVIDHWMVIAENTRLFQLSAQGPQTILQIRFSYRDLVGFPLTHWRHHKKICLAVSLFFLLLPHLGFSSPSPRHTWTFWSPHFSMANSPRWLWLCQEWWCSGYLAMTNQPESLPVHRRP